MNNSTFAGRLGRAAETRQTTNSTATGFSLAVDEYAGGGERRTLWVDCTIWGERGEKLAQYLIKGTPVSVAGQVGVRTYEANGETRAVLTLNVREITLLGSRQDGEDGQRPARTSQPARQPAASSSPPAAAAAPRSADNLPVDDDIPF